MPKDWTAKGVDVVGRRRGSMRTAWVALLTLGVAGCFASGGQTPHESVSAAGRGEATGKPPAAAARKGELAPRDTRKGMNASGDVVNPAEVEAGSGRQVTGLNGWEGEITGRPVRGSKFARLQIGMGMKQVLDIAGPPTDQGSYITGKAFIPYFFGSDRYRTELHYKGHGRLIFAGGNVFGGGSSGGNLTWIIHSANESGYR